MMLLTGDTKPMASNTRSAFSSNSEPGTSTILPSFHSTRAAISFSTTLEWAGELSIPFTTGVLVGIGENRADRLAALRAITESHLRHGHVQEVIVQNFLPKPATAMRDEPPCDTGEFLWTIAAARLILPDDIHLQAPPNLSDDFARLIGAGIDDWGGVSPVTADHVNPERPWPALDRLREATEAAGHTLAPRLTVHPEHALDPDRWIDPNLHFAVLDRSDAEGLGRDDPGAIWPERATAADVVHDGAEVVLIGHRSTAWYSGATEEPPVLVPGSGSRIDGPVQRVLDRVRAGEIAEHDDIVTLFSARGPEVVAVAELADELRYEAVGDTVTWVHNRNINYTNVCTFKCRFCGFSKGPMSLNLRGTPYLLTLDDIAERAHWDAYTAAYELAISETSTKNAPWYIVPSDRKWYRNLVVSQLLIDKLTSLKMAYPEPAVGIENIVIDR